MSQITEWLEKEKEFAEAAYAKARAACKQADATVHHLEGRLTALIHTLEAAARHEQDQPATPPPPLPPTP